MMTNTLWVCQAAGQSNSSRAGCSCTIESRAKSTSLQTSLRRYTSALMRGDRATTSRYMARFSVGASRQRFYRTDREQSELLDYLSNHPIQFFRICGPSDSTSEWTYPERQRQHKFFGCIIYSDKGQVNNAGIRISAYREQNRWVFTPVTPPWDDFQKLPPSLSLPIMPAPTHLMESPPPPMQPKMSVDRKL
jgi:hypothetical protein